MNWMTTLMQNNCDKCAHLMKERDEWRDKYGKARRLLETAWKVPEVKEAISKDHDLNDIVSII
jgi:hypothetical protein